MKIIIININSSSCSNSTSTSNISSWLSSCSSSIFHTILQGVCPRDIIIILFIIRLFLSPFLLMSRHLTEYLSARQCQNLPLRLIIIII
jgi:hypothetical protein